MKNGLTQKDRFINATITKVAELGLENLRTKHIAAEVGMSEASMFLYFGNKEGVLRAAFYEVDKRLSNLLLKSGYLIYEINDIPTFEDAAHKMWHNAYRYLIDNRNETLFTIRYRYSAYYTAEVRANRQAHNGALDRVYKVLKQRFNETENFYEGFLVNYIFELTLSFAEKIINGYLQDTPQIEDIIWLGIKNLALSLMDTGEKKTDD